MKKCILISAVLCSAWLTSCNREDDGINREENHETVSLMDGSIILNSHPNVRVTPMNSFPATGKGSMGIKSSVENDLTANDYRFKLVAQMGALTLEKDGTIVQATHVKISDIADNGTGFAYVSYNFKGNPNKGGVVVYKFIIHDGKLGNVKVDVTAEQSMEMSNAQINALDYYNGKLYMAGASNDPNFGYDPRTDRGNPSFFMVMELENNIFKEVDPAANAIVKLTSFQATSIRAVGNRIYVTTGDGTEGTKGGLYIYDAASYDQIAFIQADHARSVDVDETYIYLMQSENARVNKYDRDGNWVAELYNADNEAMQRDAKSEMLAWEKYLFVAENESGLRMLTKSGELNASLDRPGEDVDNDVTNSVAMNSDLKTSANGTTVQSNLLLLANGGKGIYWYDVMEDAEGKDRIVPCKDNSILGGTGSANYIASSGNIVFVADGLGGLKVLYIGIGSEEDIVPPPVVDPCPNVFKYDTFLKANGDDKGNPLNRKIGDVYFRAEGENLVVYLMSNQKINNSGVFFATSVDEFNKAGVMSGGGIVNGKMANMNAAKRTVIEGGVKFTFAKSDLPEGELLCIVYCSGAWGYGVPEGPSGSTGSGSNNNSQYINLGVITYCE